jgi:8-oxo-dGTP diphosphatase
MQQRHTIIPAVFIVLKKDTQIFVLRRFNTGYADGKLMPIAGHVEAGESFSQAGVREAHEEAGVTVQPEDLKPMHAMHRRNAEGQERIDVFFLVETWAGQAHNAEPNKSSEALWIESAALPADFMSPINEAVTLGLSGVFYSERW